MEKLCMITQYAQAINYENSSESIYTCDKHKERGKD